jgi:broad-specificity NMP kinase
MQKSIIVIITGMPGTGKTSLGKALSEKYHFPMISKDGLKERMFDTLGWNDKEWSLKISAASHRVMDYIIEEELKANHSIIVESNFKHDIDSERFKHIQERFGCEIVQVLCWANGEMIFERFISRIDNAERHHGHVEIPLDTIKKEFIEANGRDIPLKVNGETVELDTTDLKSIEFSKVYRAIESLT